MVLFWFLQAQLEREENWQVERESSEGRAHTPFTKAKTKRNLGSGNSAGWTLEGGVVQAWLLEDVPDRCLLGEEMFRC